jgi:hypothetical protein
MHSYVLCKSEPIKSPGRATIVGAYPFSPAARGAGENGLALNYWMVML